MPADRYLICGEDGGKNTWAFPASRGLGPEDWRRRLRRRAKSVRTAAPGDKSAVHIAMLRIGGNCAGLAAMLRSKNGG